MFEIFVVIAILMIICLVVFGLVLLFKIARNQRVLQDGQKEILATIRRL